MENTQRTVQLLVNLVLSDNSLSAQDRADALKALKTLSAHRPFNLTSRVEEILTDIGMPSSLFGYHYLVTAICLIIEDPDFSYAITTRLYPEVASKFSGTAVRRGVTAQTVERCIRHAIEVAFNRGDLDTLYKYFGNSVSKYRGKPTNSEFICQIALCVEQSLRN